MMVPTTTVAWPQTHNLLCNLLTMLLNFYAPTK